MNLTVQINDFQCMKHYFAKANETKVIIFNKSTGTTGDRLPHVDIRCIV